MEIIKSVLNNLNDLYKRRSEKFEREGDWILARRTESSCAVINASRTKNKKQKNKLFADLAKAVFLVIFRCNCKAPSE